MIKLDELKPILETLLTEREDAADIIEQVTALDLPVETPEPVDNTAEIDELNKSWNERFKKAFFGEKAEFIDESIPEAPVDVNVEVEAQTEEEDTLTGENITIEDLFKEGIID